MRIKDQSGRIISLESHPKRIVSLVPSQTELLVDLQLIDQLLGVTKFCVHPSELRKSKTIVGGTKHVRFEKIKALAPDIIIANKEENTLEMVEQLSAIAPVWVSDIYSVEDSLDFIAAMGALFDRKDIAQNLVAEIKTKRREFKDSLSGHSNKKVAYLIWKKPFMAAGKKTFINALLEDNKFENILSDPKGRYPELNLTDLKAADLVLLSSEPYPFKETDRQELEAYLGVPVMLVDGEYFSWYGSRLVKAYSYFTTLHKSL